MKTIKRTLIAVSLIILSANAVRAQQLANTFWSAYDTSNTFNLYWQFTSDTVLYSTDNVTYTPISIFTENGNSFTIADVNGTCLPTDTGHYTFIIQNDTLRFTLQNDLCIDRIDYLANYYFVSLATGVESYDVNSSVQLFPNPFSENLTITGINEPSQINLIDVTGKTILTQSIRGTVQLSTGQLAKGLYVYEIRNKTGVIKRGNVLKK